MLRTIGFHLWGGKDAEGYRKNPGCNPAPGQPVSVVRRDGLVVFRWSNTIDWKRRGQPSDIAKWRFMEDC